MSQLNAEDLPKIEKKAKLKAETQTEAKQEVTSDLGQEVESVRLHENLFIPSFGDFGKHIKKEGKFRDIKMYWNGQCLTWQYKMETGFIPGANISSGVFKTTKG